MSTAISIRSLPVALSQDAGGRFVDNTVQRNGMGAFMVVPSFDFDLDLSALKATNKLMGAVLMK